MPRAGRATVAVVGILLLVLLTSSTGVALTLPNPPDRTAPANTQNGPLPNGQSFPGGVVLVKDGSVEQNQTANEFVVEFFCIDHGPTVSKDFQTSLGESITGPLTGDQVSGLTQAVNSVRAPRTVNLTIVVGALDLGGNLTYVMSGMTYNVTTYSVWVTTQQSPPVEQRVGYVVVSVPEHPQITRLFQDLPGSSCNDVALSKYGPGWGGPLSGVSGSFSWVSKLPEGQFSPIFTYGKVRVISSAGVAAAAEIRAGENVTFVLPPGTYSAVADVVLFGIPFSLGSGRYASPSGATTAQVTVSLQSVVAVWHLLEEAALVIIIIVVVVLGLVVHLGGAIEGASKYVARGLRKGWRKLWD